ncbi:hypothetical protein ACHAXA_003820 [Cyclostephanos tholiformis]|uniref:Transmembrane protein n=1 Tax=Cyclostephanos tholiformis TaxID=382380 RepID=A0ABD3RWL0_9STRA
MTTMHTLTTSGSFDGTIDSDIGGDIDDAQLDGGGRCCIVLDEKRKGRGRSSGRRKRVSYDEDEENYDIQRRRSILLVSSFVPFLLACIALIIVCSSDARRRRVAESNEMAMASSPLRVTNEPQVATTKLSDAEIFANWGKNP